MIAKIDPIKKERFPKLEKNDLPSPVSYEIEKAFNKLKGTDRSFQISKAKRSNFTEIEIKKAAGKPSVGAYDTTRAEKITTKGFKKSYK